MRKNILILAAPALLVFTLAASGPVYGAFHIKNHKLTVVEAAGDQDQDQNEDQNQGQNKIQNCELIQTRITRRINRMDRKQERHLYVFNQIKDKLTEMASELKADGYDVSKIEEDITLWQEKMDEFRAKGLEIIQSLEQSRYLACQNKKQYKDELKQVRTKLKELMILTIQTRNFYRNQIKMDLIDLKNQKLST